MPEVIKVIPVYIYLLRWRLFVDNSLDLCVIAACLHGGPPFVMTVEIGCGTSIAQTFAWGWSINQILTAMTDSVFNQHDDYF